MKTITVLFFATLRDHMGTRQLSVELPDDAGVPELKMHLAAGCPTAAAALETALAAIDREYAFQDAAIPAGAEVAFFPHVSGG
jgi:molybdopterin converting factor subunit 1